MKISTEVAERIAHEVATAYNEGYEDGKSSVQKKAEWVQSEVPSMDECTECGNHVMKYKSLKYKPRYCDYCGALMINGGKQND